MHPYFEDLRLKDPELIDLGLNIDNRLESTKAHSKVTDVREFTGDKRGGSTKNNNIRIKTVVENPDQKRKSYTQNFGVTKINQLSFSDENVGLSTSKAGQKTYLKLYETTSP